METRERGQGKCLLTWEDVGGVEISKWLLGVQVEVGWTVWKTKGCTGERVLRQAQCTKKISEQRRIK